jgi:hypothetical protein
VTLSPLAVDLVEWESCAPEPGAQLFGRFLEEEDPGVRRPAYQLSTAGMLDIVELRQGLSLRATSYVGRVRLGDLQITIRPKIPLMCLLRFFQYAYDLRHLKLFSPAGYSAEPQTFQDPLIQQLAVEATELLSRGYTADMSGAISSSQALEGASTSPGSSAMVGSPRRRSPASPIPGLRVVWSTRCSSRA